MKRRNDTFAQAIVGLFMVTVLLLLGYFTIVISGVDILQGKEKVRLTAAFDQVGGLKDHDNVMYRGTKVGTVERVEVTPSNLVVTAYVDGGVVLRQGYRVAVCNLSMLGGNYLLLEEGAGEPVDFAATVLSGETPSDWMADVSRIARNLKDLSERFDQSGIVTNIEAATASARAIVERVERGEGLLGKLTADSDPLYEDIRATAANAREITARFNSQKLADDLDAAIADFRAVCANVVKVAEDVDVKPAIADFRAVCSNVVRVTDGVDIRRAVAGAEELMANLNEVSAGLKRGEGTLGRLATDDALYREIDGLIRDVRQVIDNYRDTTPIATFSSLATGAL